MKWNRLFACGVLLTMVLLVAGCGGEASAADSEAAAPVAEAVPVVLPAAAGSVRPASVAGSDAASGAAGGESVAVVAAGPRPALPRKAPVFHNPDAQHVLPSRLLIPAIKVDTPVVELGWTTSKTASGTIFSEWDVAEYAAGWHKNSAVPSQPGNVVMSGHNNILGSVFRELDQLKRGDTLELVAGGTEYTYTVDEVLILPEKHASDKQRKANVKYIQETPDDRLTLVSCWPRDDNTHRIVVIAKPVELSTKATN
jgi:sortase A